MVPNERPRSALILGLGGGTVARLLLARFGHVAIVGVDDDPRVIEIAAAVGWLPPAGVEIRIGDAFAFVQTCEERFDFVAVDLFRADRLAPRIFGKPFLRRLRSVLEPRGSLAINVCRDARRAERVERVRAVFDVREERLVGGNVVVHARQR
jgi:spermidine synthase